MKMFTIGLIVGVFASFALLLKTFLDVSYELYTNRMIVEEMRSNEFTPEMVSNLKWKLDGLWNEGDGEK